MTVRWGIIGIGKVADIAIAPAIEADGQSSLAAVCSRSLDRAKAFADKHGAGAAYDDYAQMLADPERGRGLHRVAERRARRAGTGCAAGG